MPTPANIAIGDMVRLKFVSWPPGHPRQGQDLQLTWNNRPFPVKEGGIPCMLVEEAILPPGCASLKDLPCQQQQAAAPAAGGTAT